MNSACKSVHPHMLQKDELTDLFIWLLADARRSGDVEGYKKLYAGAKRRRGADIVKIDRALLTIS